MRYQSADLPDRTQQVRPTEPNFETLSEQPDLLLWGEYRSNHGRQWGLPIAYLFQLESPMGNVDH